MCIEFMSGGEDPMMVLSRAIYNYSKINEVTEENIKEFLSINKSVLQKDVNDDSNYKLTKTETGYVVTMSKMGCKSGMLYEITITDNDYRYKTIYASDKKGYGDITYNEYKE